MPSDEKSDIYLADHLDRRVNLCYFEACIGQEGQDGRNLLRYLIFLYFAIFITRSMKKSRCFCLGACLKGELPV